MQTFEASLLGLVRRGMVSIDDALEAASDPHDMSLRLQQAGLAVQA
jgi:twitching motility protein PilT